MDDLIITCAHEAMFSGVLVCLFVCQQVCLFVCQQEYLKRCMKLTFTRGVSRAKKQSFKFWGGSGLRSVSRM